MTATPTSSHTGQNDVGGKGGKSSDDGTAALVTPQPPTPMTLPARVPQSRQRIHTGTAASTSVPAAARTTTTTTTTSTAAGVPVTTPPPPLPAHQQQQPPPLVQLDLDALLIDDVRPLLVRYGLLASGAPSGGSVVGGAGNGVDVNDEDGGGDASGIGNGGGKLRCPSCGRFNKVYCPGCCIALGHVPPRVRLPLPLDMYVNM
ncbi:hypothetical protein HK405_000687, partial [Cladochytrium tenue]